MLHSKALLLYFLTLVLLSCGCAKQTTVVLVPDPEGNVGLVTVATDRGSVDISQAREATMVKGRESLPTPPEILSEEAIRNAFSHALASLPKQPEHFILYFKGVSTELTDDSQKTLPKIIESITTRNSQNISVIGHADRVGNRQYNLSLSSKRAAAVGRILVKRGVEPSQIKTTSHGEENPLIKTADNVIEPRNRRVEVVIR